MKKIADQITVFWFRRDLRLHDNAGLYQALSTEKNVLPVFIFDSEILDKLEDKKDRRVAFIHHAIRSLKKEIEQAGSSLLVLYGKPAAIFKKLISTYPIKSIYTNHDYEPYAINRDTQIKDFLNSNSISFHSFKDQVIFEKSDVVKDDGSPYTIFTPYMRKWKSVMLKNPIINFTSEQYRYNFLKTEPFNLPTLNEIGFKHVDEEFPQPGIDWDLIGNYHNTRNFPAIRGTSRISVHLRFGTVSIRQLVLKAISLNEQWLNELIWREFYMCILWHFPHVAVGAFKKNYSNIEWRNDTDDYEAWCNGKTGFPIVDAGMRELNATGFMHNRVRMITSSFLTKHLLIDWRWGEAYFAQKLLDFELASNNGGWQWASGSGCDAAPYFRFFNPLLQAEKFDPKNEYIKKWIPEFDDWFNYPKPIVDLKSAKERTLNAYKKALTSR